VNRRSNSLDRQLRERAAAVIPGGMYGHQSTGRLPDDYPQFFERGKGAYLWDVDGNKVFDLMCGYGPNLLGYADEAVDAAYMARVAQGDCLTGPGAALVEFAEACVDLVSHADWAMFCKNGTDATSMAMVTARAHTHRRTLVLAKGAYHGAAPWCTPRPAGTTREDRAHQVFCDYNDIASLEAAVAEAGDDLAAIFAAPMRHDAFVDQAMPDPAYARRARELCDATGALLVVDDVRAGLRIARDCSWSKVGVQPDLSTWGKCFANGHPISALLGSDTARKAAASIYVTGSFWYQAAPMAAALATLKLVRGTDYLERMETLGTRLRTGLHERADAAGFGLRQTGPVTMPLFLFDEDPDLRKGFFWSSAMLERGVYVHPWHNMFMCAAMTEADIDQTLAAAEGAFKALKAAAPTLTPVEKLAFLTA
jgi:glutamate-1-semialdehyde 2,1-aminomutase